MYTCMDAQESQVEASQGKFRDYFGTVLWSELGTA